MKGYMTREVAEVLGLPTSRILSWTRSGLIEPRRGPRGAYVFSFQDIVLLRTAKELLKADVPARRVRESLEALREQLPVGRPLSAVTISAAGDRILVQDEDRVWEPDSGQLQIDFAVADIARAAQPIAQRALDARSGDDQMSTDEWYDSALDLEAVSVDQAMDAYRAALALDANFSDAHLNLGRLLHEVGRVEEAEHHYRQAVESDPESARAAYNLGVVLEDRGALKDACHAYLEAVRLDRDLAVAHFNLSRLFEAEGQKQQALSHLAEYKRLVERGSAGA
jgi:tetratricopeptide (TPR) repeat protein